MHSNAKKPINYNLVFIFKGKHTNWDLIKDPHEWCKEFRKFIKHAELQGIFLSGDDMVYESIRC